MSLELLYFSGGPRERVLEAVLEAGHRVLRVFVNDPARRPKVLPTIELAERHGIPIQVVAAKKQLGETLAEVRQKLCLSAGFAYLFPPEFLSAADACLNVHGSLLPKYAGARTLSWAIERGESESGVTVHLVDSGIDTGPILLQRAFPVSPFETTRSLSRKTLDFEPAVAVEALALWERHGRAALSPQTGLEPRLPDRIPQHSRIDPSRSLLELFDAIRAADPEDYPAHFFLGGEKICVRLWRPAKPEVEFDLV